MTHLFRVRFKMAFAKIFMQKTEDNVIYGRHPVVDAIREGRQFDKVMLQQGIRGDFEKLLRSTCREYEVPLQVVPKERLGRFVKGVHQGVIGFVSLLEYQHIEQVLPLIYERSEVPLLLILDGVTDVRNFGAISRTAEVAGVHAIIVPQKGAALINADALKTSAGALSKIPVCREKSLFTTIEFLQNSGIAVFVSSLEAEDFIFNLDFNCPMALVVGSEDTGVHPKIMAMADKSFIIPQVGTTNSLNVSVAAGMMLYEVMRQRIAHV
jgi:23S rRNA (guanosine2251-2'-O)-methyltransferase